ncbi:hypothetical protein Lxx19050 [Leifsonia xyli subsp. xyli str. CTCB07]|uniref:Uncharacterized protein n=1 Tax=Leifsonia xyli subsp. xyli (strain CTCB07) TaxID=281090 RepID=Q6ADB4_LEIXX|nr:hypothetical protein [Leifsonia xyli]AAT89630.1 hypothetical protein Lxx19050 [Leifsonia xyli subsp. xyli str. CTCB07]
MTANQQDQARPTGLSTARSATYDPASKRIVVEIVYSAQNSDLSGELPRSSPLRARRAVTLSPGRARPRHGTRLPRQG